MTTSWQTIGFKTGRSIHVVEEVETGNILYANYIGGKYLTDEEIEEELF